MYLQHIFFVDKKGLVIAVNPGLGSHFNNDIISRFRSERYSLFLMWSFQFTNYCYSTYSYCLNVLMSPLNMLRLRPIELDFLSCLLHFIMIIFYFWFLAICSSRKLCKKTSFDFSSRFLCSLLFQGFLQVDDKIQFFRFWEEFLLLMAPLYRFHTRVELPGVQSSSN